MSMNKISIAFIVLQLFVIPGCLNNTDSSASYRNVSHLILTKHAKCRMDCRNITEDEIKEIIKTGDVNNDKSRMGSKGDQTYALDGYDKEHQHLRIVVAPESDSLVVITCIDLEHDWSCNCY